MRSAGANRVGPHGYRHNELCRFELCGDHRDKGAKAMDGGVSDRKRWVIGDEIMDAAGDAFGVGARKIGGVRVNK